MSYKPIVSVIYGNDYEARIGIKEGEDFYPEQVGQSILCIWDEGGWPVHVSHYGYRYDITCAITEIVGKSKRYRGIKAVCWWEEEYKDPELREDTE